MTAGYVAGGYGMCVLHDHCSACSGRRVVAGDDGLEWCVCVAHVTTLVAAVLSADGPSTEDVCRGPAVPFGG